MKYLFILFLFSSNAIFADYSKHPEAQDVIRILVSEHGFDENYVTKILQTAKKQDRILESMSSPAEFTWTWDRYKKLFIEDKRITNGKVYKGKRWRLPHRSYNGCTCSGLWHWPSSSHHVWGPSPRLPQSHWRGEPMDINTVDWEADDDTFWNPFCATGTALLCGAPH